MTYAFWNNKGGTGKTSLAFQCVASYAKLHPDKRILVLDVCPQANLSELLLGGLEDGGSKNLMMRQGQNPRCTIGGYFQQRLPTPFGGAQFIPKDFITHISPYNPKIPPNVDLVCGDPLLELQANAMSTLANTQIPGTNTWISIIDWIKDFLVPLKETYSTIFIDANPSFSIYTQIALSAADRLLLPVMADDSSRRAIQNAFSLIFGLRLPSAIYSEHAFATRLTKANRTLPKVHLIIKNRLTQYMGPASAYNAVLTSIDADLDVLLSSNPEMFTFGALSSGIAEVRDFQTTGVVAFARGCPFYSLQSGKLEVAGRRVQVNEDYRLNCVQAINGVVDHL